MTTFPDVGLQLAVMNRLIEMELLDAEDVRDCLAPAVEALRGDTPPAPMTGLLGRSLLQDDDEYFRIDFEGEQQKIEGALKLLAQFPLNPEHLAQVTKLDFDGGNDIYMIIEEEMGVYTGGESEYYCPRDFEGVEQLPALKEVNVDGYAYEADTKRLKAHHNSPEILD